jgi:hypothetical protein
MKFGVLLRDAVELDCQGAFFVRGVVLVNKALGRRVIDRLNGNFIGAFG